MALLGFKNIIINSKEQTLVNNVSFSIESGEILSLVGESGSGKSLTCLSILQLLPKTLAVKGAIEFESQQFGKCNLLNLPAHQLQKLALKEIAYIFQEPMTALNPVQTCGQQLLENIKLCGYQKADQKQRLLELLEMVDLNDHERVIHSYPFQLSGGQR